MPNMNMLSVGANKGYEIRSFLNRYDTSWKVTGSGWRQALLRRNTTAETCGACAECRERSLWRTQVEVSIGAVLAVEAEPTNAHALQGVFNEFGVGSRGGRVIHAAAMDSFAKRFAYVPKVGQAGWEKAVPQTTPDEDKPHLHTRVPTTSIDHLMFAHKLKQIEWCLIDVEGHDHAVLRGAEQALRTHSLKVVAFEYGSRASRGPLVARRTLPCPVFIYVHREPLAHR